MTLPPMDLNTYNDSDGHAASPTTPYHTPRTCQELAENLPRTYRELAEDLRSLWAPTFDR